MRRREIARATGPAWYGYEDHGMLAVTLAFEGPGWGQSIALCFDKHSRTGFAEFAAVLLALRHIKKGWTGYVLRDERDNILGVEPLEVDPGEPVDLVAVMAEARAMKVVSP